MTAGSTASGDARGAVELANAYVDARNYVRAMEVLRDALTASPNDAVLLANLARAQVLTKDYASAAGSAHAALAISPEDAFAMRIYTIALDGTGAFHQAMWMAWRTASTHPHDRLAHFVYAELLLRAGRPGDALFVVDEALRIDASRADSQVLRGQILARLGRSDESTAAYEQALALDPSNASAVHNIGVNRLARSKWSAAFRGFLGAARLDPELGNLARENIAIALGRLLRFATLGVVVLGYVLFLSAPSLVDPSHRGPGPQIVVGVFTAALLGYTVWVLRVVPPRTLRSVLRIRPGLALRLGLVVCALLFGAVVTAGLGQSVSAVAGVLLIFGALLVSFVGRLSGG